MFCSLSELMYVYHYTQKKAVQKCPANSIHPFHAFSSPSFSALVGEKKQSETGHSMLPLSRTVNCNLGLLHKGWDWEGREERIGSQLSFVSFGTIQLHGSIVIFPSDLRKQMRAPSVLGSGKKLGSSLAISLIPRWQHSTEMLNDPGICV